MNVFALSFMSSFLDFSTGGEHRHHEVWSAGGERGAEVGTAGWGHPELRPGPRLLQTSHRGGWQGWDPSQTGPTVHYQPHPPSSVGQRQPVRQAGLTLLKQTN